MSIVAVQFQDKRNPEEFAGREYTYYSNVPLAVGDVIVAPTSKGKGVVRVCRTDMADADIPENARPYMKTIEEKIRPEDLEV